jgi:hypothetical protein
VIVTSKSDFFSKLSVIKNTNFDQYFVIVL